jgi:uncharacterized SAM-binding protein YcdF (DUF218 family)
MPVWWLLALLVYRHFTKKPVRKKIAGYAFVILLLLLTNPWLFRQASFAWQPHPVVLPIQPSYEAGIVLGGLSGYDKFNRGYFGGNADRFIQTANLYHQGIIKKIIVSGGTGKLSQDEPGEAFFLLEQFKANGIPAKDIFIESASRNTYENALFSKKITDSLKLRPPFVLITSAQHMKRSEAVFNKAGFQCISYPCDYKVIPTKNAIDNTVLPNIGLLNEWAFLLKEIVGLYVYRLTGKA